MIGPPHRGRSSTVRPDDPMGRCTRRGETEERLSTSRIIGTRSSGSRSLRTSGRSGMARDELFVAAPAAPLSFPRRRQQGRSARNPRRGTCRGERRRRRHDARLRCLRGRVVRSWRRDAKLAEDRAGRGAQGADRGSDALLLTEYRGLTVSEIAELRRSLREGGASFAVIKNTLMRRAASDAGHRGARRVLERPERGGVRLRRPRRGGEIHQGRVEAVPRPRPEGRLHGRPGARRREATGAGGPARPARRCSRRSPVC